MAPTGVPSNTRATRSRFSSPQTAANGAINSSRTQGSGHGANGTEEQKTLLQRWLEPPVQVKASYQDAGLLRHGVLENMAPLGTLPKVGLFKNTAPPAAAPAPAQKPVPRIIVKPRAPAAAPPPAPEEDETEEEDGDDDANTENVCDRDEEEMRDEGEHHKARAATGTSRLRRSIASRDTDGEEWAPAKSAQKGEARRSLSRASAGPLGSVSSMQRPAASASSRQLDQKQAIDKVVEAAVDEALAHHRYPTAWALRTLHDENSSNQEFLDMIEQVFRQTADAATLEEFACLIQAKKIEGKKDNKAFYYFVPPSANSREPKPAPYGHLVKFDMSTLRLGPVQGAISQKRERPAPEPEPEPEREPEPEPPRKKRKSGRHSEAASKMATNGVSSKAKTETPSRKRTRANSMSSTSSLSSARSLTPPNEARQEDEEGEGLDVTPSRTSPAPSQQPITAGKPRRSNAPPRKSRNVSPSRPSPQPPQAPAPPSQQNTSSQRPSPAAEQPAAAEAELQPYEMPAVVDSPLFPSLNPKKGARSGASTVVFPSRVGKIDENDPKLRLRQNARRVTSGDVPPAVSDTRESYARGASRQEEAEQEAQPAPASRLRTSLPAARPTPAPREGRSTRSSLKRTHDELDEQPSPTAGYFPGSETASTAADSRAGTPALRPTKRARTGLRVKTSPMKKKNGTSAGIPRPSGERNSPVGNGNANREDDNDDYCSSCGGNGDLICCDGCTRSLHLSCMDPVLRQDAMPPEWFCNVCRTRRDPAAVFPHGGSFALLLDRVDVKNSSAFRLPGKVRNRFESVRTGIDGEYEENVTAVKPTRKKRNEEEQSPDYFRLRDAEGNLIICHGCQRSSVSNRAIIPCSVCGINWHLDCLDPPLANPPVSRNWRCPLHIEDLLAKVPGSLGPAHRFRKIKNAPVIRPAFSRGYVNNGYIEVELDDSENHSGWRDLETYGRTVRLPEEGIMLDFLSRARENRKGKPIPPLNDGAPAAAATIIAPAPPASRPMERRSLEEQQAALNLMQLGGNGDAGVATLVDALISQADPSVVDIMARANPAHLENTAQLNQMDQQSLRAMLARAEAMTDHIRHLLASAAPVQPLLQAVASSTTVEAPAAVPRLAKSQSPDSDSQNAGNIDVSAGSLENDATKSPASPAASDDVPAMTQGEKTPVQGDQSPEVPLPLDEEGTPVEDGGLPTTPTKATVMSEDEPLVLEAHGEKALGEENPMVLE